MKANCGAPGDQVKTKDIDPSTKLYTALLSNLQFSIANCISIEIAMLSQSTS